jgi:hypothetical protein
MNIHPIERSLPRADIIKESINVNTPRSFAVFPEKSEIPTWNKEFPSGRWEENHPHAEIH